MFPLRHDHHNVNPNKGDAPSEVHLLERNVLEGLLGQLASIKGRGEEEEVNTPVRVTIHLSSGNRIEELIDNTEEVDENEVESAIFNKIRFTSKGDGERREAPHWEQIGSTLVFTGAVSAVELTHFG